MANKVTTIQISKEASEKLRALAETYKRSKSSHAEWLIEQDYRKLEEVKLVGAKVHKELKSKNNPAVIQT